MSNKYCLCLCLCLYIKLANTIKLQSQTRIVPWELSQMTQVKKQPTHTTPSSSDPATFTLPVNGHPLHALNILSWSFSTVWSNGATPSRCRGRGGYHRFHHIIRNLYNMTFNREANVSRYIRTPNRLEKINITVIVTIDHNDSKDI